MSKKENKTDKKIIKLKKERDDFENKYKRALADYQNLIKRQIKEKEEFIKYANEQLIQEIIPIFDNLKMALNYVDEKNKDDKWVTGVKYVTKQFREILNSNKIEEIKIGKKFNPETMDALEGNSEKVKKEVKSGYTLNGKVIIPAKVILKNK